MAEKRLVRNLAVGLVFFVSLIIVGVASLLVSNVSLFHQVEALEVRFPDVDDLQEGDNVRLHGMRIGQVESIRYDPATFPAQPIVVRCSVPRDVRATMAGASFTIHSAGPLGGRYLEVTPPPVQGVPAPPPGVAVGSAPGDLFKQLEKLVSSNEQTIRDLLKNFADAVAEIKDAFQAVNQGEGMLGDFVKNRELRDRTQKGIADFFDVIENLKGEKGTIPYLLNNEEAKRDVKDAIAELRAILKEVREGKGLAGQLISDEDIPKRVREILDDAHEIVHKANTGQGTLGQIINNRKAWDELVKLLVLARETVEDIREQAPISTFVNAAFAAF